ncbi:homeobox-leucine zipper protein protodermal factor 2 [Nicotiana attenuata]|uniref:Homeobox-leucine zipper protein protodermal factor 2 n=2 Tax=Nicotiana attenuata TaxID=49451 RepID=A0A314LEQ5_NICAT|nr:homeobox-leucine zipper protein protodermal factor 2 [Nicotiana attenuata]
MFPEDKPGLEHFGYLESMSVWERDMPRASDLLLSVSMCAEVYKGKIVDLALAASEEIRQMAQEQEPLWLFDTNNQTEILNEAEYKRRFVHLDPTLEEIIKVIARGGPIDIPNLNGNVENAQMSMLEMENSAMPSEIEASRAIGVVLVDPINLVNMLMDVDQWSCVFSNIVSKATNLGLLMTGADGNPNGSLQVMTAQFHLPSPLVRPREVYFARYSRQLDFNTWLVTDVSLESIFPNPLVQCQRRPSGCLIQGLQTGLSLVTWVEHNVVCNGLVPQMFRQILKSGVAFSAKRWMLTMERHYDRNATVKKQYDQPLEQPLQDNNIEKGRKNLVKLAERMVRSYNAIFSSCSENQWMPLRIQGGGDIFVKTGLNLDARGTPRGVAVTISTSVWLPIPQKDVFEFLRAGDNRCKWDLLSIGCMTRDELHISSARDPANSVSLVMVEPPNGREDKSEMFYLQESFTDSTVMYIIYAPVDASAVQYIMEGKDSDDVVMLASGFAVLPLSPEKTNFPEEIVTGGSVLTMAFQLMDEELSTPEYLPPHSVFTANKLVSETISLIKDSLLFKSAC